MLAVITRNVDETVGLGEALGRFVEPGDFIALTGELGSGKTQFVRGIASGISVGASVPITSPTYTLVNEYVGRVRLCHFDLYRLRGADDAVELGFEEFFYGNAVCVVEWAERLEEELPPERLSVSFAYCGENERRIEFIPHGQRYETLLKNVLTEVRIPAIK